MTRKEIAQAKIRLTIESLEPAERETMMKLTEAFRDAAQETIKGGEELLKMCDGCAFRRGAEGNNDPHTCLSATECVLNDEPFYCHKRFSEGGHEKICNGWINVMNNK